MNKKILIGVIIGVILLIGFFGFNFVKKDNRIKNANSVDLPSGLASGIVGPGGCEGDECNNYCRENQEECETWCGENQEVCGELMAAWGSDIRGDEQPKERNNGIREGDGVWEKNELTFYIIDEENILSDEKRKIIQDVFISEKKSSGGFWGWNKALEELNRLYPDNIVPDKFIEVFNENEAVFLVYVYSQKEFCCDLGGEPVRGRERSEIDENSVKIKSRVYMYNVIDAELGFFGDVMRHEVGHGIGLFGHVTNRDNDLMSLISPSSVIKVGNLNDLYVKYRDRKIETIDEARSRDLEVYDEKVGFPS